MKNIGKISGFIGETQPVQGSSAFYFLMYMGIMYSIGREHLEVVASSGIVVELLYCAATTIKLLVITTVLLLKVNNVWFQESLQEPENAN